MIHRWEGDRFRYDIPRDRLHNDAETRYVDAMLAIIVGRNDEPLARCREPGDRFVGVCRDFALLYSSFLRHVGVLADALRMDLDPLDIPRARFTVGSALTADDVPFDEVRKAFVENARLRTPATVLSLAPCNGPREVTLREEVFAEV